MLVEYDAHDESSACFLVACALLCSAAAHSQNKDAGIRRDWPVWGGGPENMHYSHLAHDQRSNVKKLGVAWCSIPASRAVCRPADHRRQCALRNHPTQKIFALMPRPVNAMEIRFGDQWHTA